MRKVAEDLTARGHTIWFDEWEILVGDSITHAVGEGLDQSEYMILALSRHAVESSWVEREWSAAYAKELEGNKKVVLPALLEECSVPALLKDKRRVHLGADYDAAVNEIDTVLRGERPKKPTPGAEAPRPAPLQASLLDRLRAIPSGDKVILQYVPRSRRPDGLPHEIPIVWGGVDEPAHVVRFTCDMGGVTREHAPPISDVEQAWRPDMWHVRLSGFLDLNPPPADGSRYVSQTSARSEPSLVPQDRSGVTFDPYAALDPGSPGFIDPYGGLGFKKRD